MALLMTVGQISKLFNVTSETLRHYDRIRLLKPIINKDNGYRYYSIKEIEKLDLILDAKYLEIPLQNIKEALSNDKVENYIDLIELQEETIDEKIEHLLKIKEQAKEKKIILNEMMNFENNYDFDKLEVVDQSDTIIFVPIENLIKGKVKQKDSSSKSLYLEPWMGMYKVKGHDTLVEDLEYIGVKEKHTSNLLIEKDNKIIKKSYNGKAIKTKFVGTIEEIEEYIRSIIKHFYKEKENIELDISVSWIWVLYNEKGTINFSEITIPLK